MQIVIDIPDEYKKLLDNGDADGSIRKLILLAVANGTPLPKGHGRLADLDAALKCVEETADCDEKYYAMCLFDWAMSKRVVLEADKEQKDE
mgnify:CR=1 FL=1